VKPAKTVGKKERGDAMVKRNGFLVNFDDL